MGWKQFQNNAFVMTLCLTQNIIWEASITKVIMLINIFSSKPVERWPNKQWLLAIYGIVKHFRFASLIQFLLFFGKFIDSDILRFVFVFNLVGVKYIICD